ncbi:calcium-binding protein [Pseudemcibacter aquimaris]|uniref:calcium-binding protein n=1 Tax=Pseudemcibacter aquimaris TaxID=2857064 RepID=UPI0020131FE2|nr:calcium-binding protein [Pseudemcibacter aquimaris]MCC3861254.1 hypothetical protein [Pseudemcibacter aquimaris]WDU58028.1 hypothetical protein KW060_12590 [Pseudemcibacter aquimaris]
MKKRALENVKFFKKPKLFGLGISAILISGCNSGHYHYGADTVIVTEYVYEDYGPSSYFYASSDTYEAYDDADHILEQEYTGRDLVVFSYGGDDIIDTGSGDDIIYGGGGDDLIHGHHGFDDIYGESGFDDIYGGSGDDHLDGGSGNDWIYGGSGDDDLYGGSGNDLMSGGLDIDYLYGEGGDDTFEVYEDEFSDLEDYFDGGSGFDTLQFFAEDPFIPFFLDLSLIDAVDIEVIDLGNFEDEISVELTVDDVIDITDGYNELIIEGDSGDEVFSVGEGWFYVGEEAGANVYTFADVTLLVDEDIPQLIT